MFLLTTVSASAMTTRAPLPFYNVRGSKPNSSITSESILRQGHQERNWQRPPSGHVGDLREAPFVIGPMGPLDTKYLPFSIKRKEISQEELFLNWLKGVSNFQIFKTLFKNISNKNIFSDVHMCQRSDLKDVSFERCLLAPVIE